MSKTAKGITALVIAVVLSAVAIALLYGPLTASANKITQKKLEQSFAAVIPGGVGFSKVDYKGDDSNIISVYKCSKGNAIVTKTYGYVDYITLLVGVDSTGKVTGVKVLEIAETAGLGMQAATTDWLTGFTGKSGTLTVGENVDSMTGATVSSKAIVKGVNSAVAYVTGADIGSSASNWEG